MQAQTNYAAIFSCITMIIVAIIAVSMLLAPEPVTPTEPASAEEIAALTAANILLNIEIPEVDTSKFDRLCELTDGCEFYEGGSYNLNALNDVDAREDFEEALADLVNIDEDYLTYSEDTSFDNFDYQVRAYSEDDADDDNWECKVFLRIEYSDDDNSDDEEVIYVLITSTLDEGEYDELTIQEVSRNFEFD